MAEITVETVEVVKPVYEDQVVLKLSMKEAYFLQHLLRGVHCGTKWGMISYKIWDDLSDIFPSRSYMRGINGGELIKTPDTEITEDMINTERKNF
jgi:hypothetical protein